MNSEGSLVRDHPQSVLMLGCPTYWISWNYSSYLGDPLLTILGRATDKYKAIAQFNI